MWAFFYLLWIVKEMAGKGEKDKRIETPGQKNPIQSNFDMQTHKLYANALAPTHKH